MALDRRRRARGRRRRSIVDAGDLVVAVGPDRRRRGGPATFQTSGRVEGPGAHRRPVTTGRAAASSSSSAGPASRPRVAVRPLARRRERSARRSSSRSMPFLMLWRVLTTSPSSPTRTLTAYSSAPRRTSSASASASAMMRRLSASACLGQAALVDQERGLLLGTGDDPLRLLLGLLDDPLALGVDALRGADLFGDGDAELVDEAERGVLVDDDVVRQRQLLAVRDERLEALDEEDDVDLVPSGWAATGTAASSVDYGTRPWASDAAHASAVTAVERRSAAATAQGRRRGRRDHRRHVAAERGDLLDEARADVAVLDRRS